MTVLLRVMTPNGYTIEREVRSPEAAREELEQTK